VYCRFNLFEGCANAKTCTFILRGGAEQFLEETERSLHDAIMIVRRTMKNDAVVAGTALFTCKERTKLILILFLQVVVL
jgi:chaperonin GroEL (HSP60 family)